MRAADIAAVSPRLALIVAGSTAIAAPDETMADLFEHAIALPGVDRWPFDRPACSWRTANACAGSRPPPGRGSR
jgi:hypothetical protein